MTTILGSPKRKGNTAGVLGLFEGLIAPEHDVQRVNIADVEVAGCLGCGACQAVPGEPGCVQKDDTGAIFGRLMESDAVVYASPLYVWGLSSQMKALVDRHFCLVKFSDGGASSSLIAGTRVALLVTCAGPVEGNADLVQEVFNRVAGYAQCDVAGTYVVPFCTSPDALGDAAKATAAKMAADLLTS